MLFWYRNGNVDRYREDRGEGSGYQDLGDSVGDGDSEFDEYISKMPCGIRGSALWQRCLRKRATGFRAWEIGNRGGKEEMAEGQRGEVGRDG